MGQVWASKPDSCLKLHILLRVSAAFMEELVDMIESVIKNFQVTVL